MGLSLRLQLSCGKVTTLAQENDNGLQEQLIAFQTDFRETLSSRYGLDPVLAKAIPLGTAQEMEDYAKAVHASIQNASGNPAGSGAGKSGPGVAGDTSSRNIRLPVDALLARKYKGPSKG